MKLRLGFIGIGAMGRSHLHAMQVNCGARAEAVAICSQNEENIQRALQIAPKAKVFRDAQQLIDADLDAVFVSTPNFLHVPTALAVLQAGKHCFLEKPVGISRAEAQQLLETVEKSERVVLVGHELRYSPYFQKIKTLIEQGEIGQPRLVWCQEFRGPFQKKSRNWIEDERQSGGALVDKNCHHFDLMNWWVGSAPRFVSGFGRNSVNRVLEGPHQVLDHATVSFQYQNGVIGSLDLCLFAPELQGEDLKMGIVGDEGCLATRLSALELHLWKRTGTAPRVVAVEAQRGEGWGGHLGFAEIHEAFLNAILNEQPHFTPVSDCLHGTLLALAAEESIKTRSVVEL